MVVEEVSDRGDEMQYIPPPMPSAVILHPIHCVILDDFSYAGSLSLPMLFLTASSKALGEGFGYIGYLLTRESRWIHER